MPQTALPFLAVLAALLIAVAFVVPAGYGLPGPVYGVIVLLSTVPGLIVGWFIYRHYVKRDQVPALGDGLPEAAEEEDRETVVAPNAERAHEQVASFKRAAGEEPPARPLGSAPGDNAEER
jgi:hypothetical protein